MTTIATRTKLLEKVRDLLSERLFSEQQISKIIPRLHEGFIKEPENLSKVVDTWHMIMNNADTAEQHQRSIPALAQAPQSSLLGKMKVDLNTILADIEPDLLLIEPDKLRLRHQNVQNLGLTQNLGELWLLLYNAPRGFYLQDWVEITKKVYYIEHRLLDFLYDKKELKTMKVHPLVKSAAAIEADFDHVRTRYLFASRSGYKALSHLYSVQMAINRPTLRDLILSDNDSYLSTFTPFCSKEEYQCFSNLLKRRSDDEDDADVFEKLAELDSLKMD